MSRTRASESEDMTDKERILSVIVRDLYSTQILGPGKKFATKVDYGTNVHFANYRKPVKGDLVLATSGQTNPWTIAWYESGSSSTADHVVLEIGTHRPCNYGNVTFVPIVGVYKDELLDGDKRRFYVKVLKAFRKADDYIHLFGGLDFDGEEAVIHVREWMGGMHQTSTPYSIRMKWSESITVAKIVKAMIAGGYGKTSFRQQENYSADELADVVME